MLKQGQQWRFGNAPWNSSSDLTTKTAVIIAKADFTKRYIPKTRKVMISSHLYLPLGKSYAHLSFHPVILWSYHGLEGIYSIPCGLSWIEMDVSFSTISVRRPLLLSME